MAYEVNLKEMSFSDYLHEKAGESRHNESMSFMIAILGSVFMVSGITQTLLTAQRPDWFLVFPYYIGSSANDFTGLAFTFLGTILLIGGVILTVHYRAQSNWYSNTLKKEYSIEPKKPEPRKEQRIKFHLQSQRKK